MNVTCSTERIPTIPTTREQGNSKIRKWEAGTWEALGHDIKTRDRDKFSTQLFTFLPNYVRFHNSQAWGAWSDSLRPSVLVASSTKKQANCLDTPKIGVTGLMVRVEDNRIELDLKAHEHFFTDIQRKCENPVEDIFN
jgi:hypothetical protein